MISIQDSFLKSTSAFFKSFPALGDFLLSIFDQFFTARRETGRANFSRNW